MPYESDSQGTRRHIRQSCADPHQRYDASLHRIFNGPLNGQKVRKLGDCALDEISQLSQLLPALSTCPMANSGPLVAVLGASTMATVQFLILAGVGAVAAIRPKAGPLLSPEKVSFLARLANDVFMPCWTMATIGAQVDLAQLRKDWAIVILGFLTVFLGFAIADLTALLFRPTQ